MDTPSPSAGHRGSAVEVVIRTREGLRYRAGMKKPNPIKLTVRRETLRALADIELTRVAGGDTALARETCKVMCPNLDAVAARVE